jgi:predicted metalloprotease with PDZ domain
MVGLLLDLVIRDATDNGGSLDGVLRALYQSTYLHGRGFTSDEFWATASRIAGGKSFADFSRRFVEGAEPLPFDSILPLAGMRLISEKLPVPRLGITSFGDSTGSRVTSVVPGGPYAQAGGLANDTIIVLGGIPVASDPDFSAFRRRWAGREGDSFPIEIRRAGQPVTLTAKVVLVDRTETRLEFDSTAAGKALRVRQGLLRGDGKP